MFFRSLFALILISTLFIQILNAINPAYFQQGDHQELIDNNSNNNNDDEEHPMFVVKQNIDEDYFIKRNKYPNFYLSPLWLSRRTRSNRLYGKPLWISRAGG